MVSIDWHIFELLTIESIHQTKNKKKGNVKNKLLIFIDDVLRQKCPFCSNN